MIYKSIINSVNNSLFDFYYLDSYGYVLIVTTHSIEEAYKIIRENAVGWRIITLKWISFTKWKKPYEYFLRLFGFSRLEKFIFSYSAGLASGKK